MAKPAKTAKRKTCAQLDARIYELEARLSAAKQEAEAKETELRDCLANARGEIQDLRKRLEDKGQKLDEVKERLAYAEAQNSRLCGYLDRVREDDTVREELVTIGEPNGEQRLVPKRRPAKNYDASTMPRGGEPDNLADHLHAYTVTTQKRRHWVTY